MTCVRSYRESMAEFSQMKTLDLWYTAPSLDELVAQIKDPKIRKRGLARMQKEWGKSIAEDIFPKLAEQKGGLPFIKDQLPTIFHMKGYDPGQVSKILANGFAKYRKSLHHAQQSLLDRYQLRDAAIKVVGVGSVGTACWVMLFMASEGDPLFLQVKEAGPSVLEPYAGKSVFANHGERVVNGIRLMQPSSDMFLGWGKGSGGRHYYLRQLKDVKITARVENWGAPELNVYATWCGRALALSHARSGSSVMLSGYMGNSDTFDRALADFSVAYADQAEKDHAAFDRVVRSGKVKAQFEEAG